MASTSADLSGDFRVRDRRFFQCSDFHCVCVLLAAAAVILPLLGRKMLANWDEAIYAEVAREFLGRNWLIPTWQFQPWLEKPPLGMWITAVFFHLFGATQFWARAASGVFWHRSRRAAALDRGADDARPFAPRGFQRQSC